MERSVSARLKPKPRYSKTLLRSVGHIPGTALPGAKGNAGLAAHRDTYFRDLGKLAPGDVLNLSLCFTYLPLRRANHRNRGSVRYKRALNLRHAYADTCHLLSVSLRGKRAETIHRRGSRNGFETVAESWPHHSFVASTHRLSAM